MRFTILVLLLIGLLGYPIPAVAQPGEQEVEGRCGRLDPALNSACRQFADQTDSPPNTTGPALVVLQFITFAFDDTDAANEQYDALVQEASEARNAQPTDLDLAFSDRQEAFFDTKFDTTTSGGTVVFQRGTVVARWMSAGARIDSFGVFEDVLAGVGDRTYTDDVTGQVMSLLPSIEDVPEPLTLQFETSGGAVDLSGTGEADEMNATSANEQDLEPAEYEATIAALETRVAELESGNTSTQNEPTAAAGGSVFIQSGSGTGSTQTFSVEDDWQLNWTYDCSSFGLNGNFIVIVYEDSGDLSLSNQLVNQLGPGDSGTQYYRDDGEFYLEINSTCDWTIDVVD